MKYKKQQALHIRCSFDPDKLLKLIEAMEEQTLNEQGLILLFPQGEENEDNNRPDSNK